MRTKFYLLKEILKKTRSELGALNTLDADYGYKNSEVGQEIPLRFEIGIMFNRHEYHVNRILYHADRFIQSLENFKASTFPTGNGKSLTSWTDKSLYYEFDSFIATSASIFEEPFKKDAQLCFQPSVYKAFEQLFPTKSTAGSLLWRLTIIRNRVVHPDQPIFSANGGRYMEFSSYSSNMVEVEDGFPSRLNAHLVDIANDPLLKRFLENDIIRKTRIIRSNFENRVCENSCSPILPDFLQLLFQSSGERKAAPQMVAYSGINLIESFRSIAEELASYLSGLHTLFAMSYVKHLDGTFNDERSYEIDPFGNVAGWRPEGKGDQLPNLITHQELFKTKS